MITKNHPEKSLQFICESCDFICSKKSNYVAHMTTRKHKNNDKTLQPTEKKAANYNCECGKKYKHRQGLYTHKKKCTTPEKKPHILYNKEEPNLLEELLQENKDFKNVILELVKSNTDLQKQMLEVCKNSNSNSNINSHNHSHNKTFNMQFFLNEQCKDAMNIMDFVDTFKLDFSDLEKVGEIGYVEGMSNLIIQKLNEMDVYKRPIHCSDAKREIMYVKDKNIWEKENGTHDRLRLFIRYIGKKNTDLLVAWCEAHPGSCDSDNILNDIYMEMVMQSMGGRGDREENENKIMRKIARTCLIDKGALPASFASP